MDPWLRNDSDWRGKWLLWIMMEQHSDSWMHERAEGKSPANGSHEVSKLKKSFSFFEKLSSWDDATWYEFSSSLLCKSNSHFTWSHTREQWNEASKNEGIRLRRRAVTAVMRKQQSSHKPSPIICSKYHHRPLLCGEKTRMIDHW